jgi:hypothetical protein
MHVGTECSHPENRRCFPIVLALVGLVIHFGVPNLLTKYHQQVLEIDQEGQWCGITSDAKPGNICLKTLERAARTTLLAALSWPGQAKHILKNQEKVVECLD